MRVTNKTRWKTADLKAILLRSAREELGQETIRRLRVEILYRKTSGSSCSGYAVIGGFTSLVRVPRRDVDKVDLAYVARHEFAHNRGLDHAAMRGCPLYRRVGRWREHYAWAEAMPLREKDRPPAPAPLAERREAAAREQLEEWERRLRRAAAKVRRYRARVRYYEKRKAAVLNQEEHGRQS